jgi:tetratricopeptide (TPR) repeat protein
VHEENLSDFSESSFIKILQRDPEVERRSRSGELPMTLLSDLHEKFGGTPRFILQIREVVKEMDVDELVWELANVKLPAGAQPGELQKVRDKYFGEIFTERLYGYLTPESQRALCRVAVYGIPVTLQGLDAAAEVSPDKVQAFARSWQDRAFIYHETKKSVTPWFIYGLLRNWLLVKLSRVERKNAHKLAGDFLYGLLEQGKEMSLGLSWVDCLLEARIQYLQANDLERARDATNILSSHYLNKGNYEDVKDLNNYLIKYEPHSRSMIWIGLSYLNQGNYSKAVAYFNNALSLVENPVSIEGAAALRGLAVVERLEGNFENAKKILQEVQKIGRKINNLGIEVSSLQELAIIDHDLGETDGAIKKLSSALEIEQKIGKKVPDPAILHNLGAVYMRKKEHDKSLEYLLEALKIEQQRGDKHGEGMTFSELAMEALWRDHLENGLSLFILSTIILKSIGHLLL